MVLKSKFRDVLTVEEESGHTDADMESEGSGAEGNETAVHGVQAERSIHLHGLPRKGTAREIVRKKRLTKKQVTEKRKGHVSLLTAGLIRPDAATDKEKERLLRRIATKGVVQLFNAVAARQESMSDELEKKMTTKERKEATERLRGSNFDVYGDKSTKNVKRDVEDDENDDEALDTSEVKEESDDEFAPFSD